MLHCLVEKCKKLTSDPWWADFIHYWTLLTIEFRSDLTSLCKVFHWKGCLRFKSVCLCVSSLSAICHWLSLGGTSDVTHDQRGPGWPSRLSLRIESFVIQVARSMGGFPRTTNTDWDHGWIKCNMCYIFCGVGDIQGPPSSRLVQWYRGYTSV